MKSNVIFDGSVCIPFPDSLINNNYINSSSIAIYCYIVEHQYISDSDYIVNVPICNISHRFDFNNYSKLKSDLKQLSKGGYININKNNTVSIEN